VVNQAGKRERASYSLQPFTHADIAGLVALSASVGWDYDEREVRTVMAAGRVFGHRDEAGRIVSSAAIVPYDDSLASIGMVIVDESCRGMGLGRQVTQACVDSVSARTAIMLIATEQGKPLYERMGFVPVSCVHKYLCDRYQPAQPKPPDHPDRPDRVSVIPCRQEHFDSVVRLDREAAGADRSRFLRERIEQAKEYVIALDQRDHVVGYALSVQGPVHLVIGPIVAPDREIAALLADKLAGGYPGRLRIDVPCGREDFLPFLESRGFRKANQPPVMVKNARQLPKRSGTLYGIAAQIFG
jgi:ribosomal protein S18 acetylase RimI-like enzyme